MVAGAIVILGWLIVERFARRRDRRQAIKDMTIAFGQQIEEIISAGTEFYQLNGATAKARALSTLIKSKLASLPDYVAIMKLAGLSFDASNHIKVLRQTITGGDFDSMTREALPDEHGLFQSIATAGADLTAVVELGYYEWLMPKPFWKRLIAKCNPWRDDVRKD